MIQLHECTSSTTGCFIGQDELREDAVGTDVLFLSDTWGLRLNAQYFDLNTPPKSGQYHDKMQTTLPLLSCFAEKTVYPCSFFAVLERLLTIAVVNDNSSSHSQLTEVAQRAVAPTVAVLSRTISLKTPALHREAHGRRNSRARNVE